MSETKKRVRPATSIPIDPDKLRLVLRRRFINNREASELLGKSSDWMAVVLHKRRINFYVLDDLADEPGYDRLITEAERQGIVFNGLLEQDLSPGEFAHRVRKRVDEDGIKTVVVDSLNGYQASMPEEYSLVLHVHELLQYLNRVSDLLWLMAREAEDPAGQARQS